MFEKELDQMCVEIRKAASGFIETVLAMTCQSAETAEPKPDKFPVGSYVNTEGSLEPARVISCEDGGFGEYIPGHVAFRYPDGHCCRYGKRRVSPWKPAVGDEVWISECLGRAKVTKLCLCGGIRAACDGDRSWHYEKSDFHPIEFAPPS